MNPSPLTLRRPASASAGFSLVEIVIALSIIAFAFLSIIGVMGTGLASDQNATMQTTATNIASSIISDLQSTQNTNPSVSQTLSSPHFLISLPKYNPTTVLPTAPQFPNASSYSSNLYFDGNANKLTAAGSSVPANALFLAKVTTRQSLSVSSATATTYGNPVYIARIVVLWPATSAIAAGTQPPSGSVELVTQFQLHAN